MRETKVLCDNCGVQTDGNHEVIVYTDDPQQRQGESVDLCGPCLDGFCILWGVSP